jgi:outer membrane protein assembly factor BamB
MTAPAVHPDGTAYVGSQDGVVYAVDVATGDVQWTADTGDWLVGGLTATTEHVLVGSYTDRLHAFDTATGREVWSVRGTGYPTGAPLVTDDAVYYTERADGDRPGRCYRLVAV